MELKFDEEKHLYTLDGVTLPSVTQILKGGGLIEGGKFFNEFTASRGTAIHKACELDDLGTLDESTLHPDLLGYLRAWRKFKSDNAGRVEFLEIEKINYHPTLRYAGTADRFGKFDGKQALWDIKSGVAQPWHGPQLSGYGNFYQGPSLRFAVYVKADGSYTTKEYTDRRDLSVFMAALTIANWRNQYGTHQG